MKYEYVVLMCANKRLQVYLYNRETQESIRLDDAYEDVKKLYQVLKKYFEGGEHEICYPKGQWRIND